jgi:hypothetical protein
MSNKLAANKEVVRRMADHLTAAYEEFIDQELAAGRAVGYLDGFMAVHNLHCGIVFNLEAEAEFTGQAAQMFRRMALDTFAQRLRKEPLPGEDA